MVFHPLHIIGSIRYHRVTYLIELGDHQYLQKALTNCVWPDWKQFEYILLQVNNRVCLKNTWENKLYLQISRRGLYQIIVYFIYEYFAEHHF